MLILEDYANSLNGGAKPQSVEILALDTSIKVDIEKPNSQLAVGSVQEFLDRYVKENEGVVVDYIHGEEIVKELSKKPNTIGILFDGMSKDMLFKTVIFDGALPRKTFSMGHAEDKRFYLECRKI